MSVEDRLAVLLTTTMLILKFEAFRHSSQLAKDPFISPFEVPAARFVERSPLPSIISRDQLLTHSHKPNHHNYSRLSTKNLQIPGDIETWSGNSATMATMAQQSVYPKSHVGFDSITSQIERKLLKRGFQFNVICVGTFSFYLCMR